MVCTPQHADFGNFEVIWRRKSRVLSYSHRKLPVKTLQQKSKLRHEVSSQVPLEAVLKIYVPIKTMT